MSETTKSAASIEAVLAAAAASTRGLSREFVEEGDRANSGKSLVALLTELKQTAAAFGVAQDAVIYRLVVMGPEAAETELTDILAAMRVLEKVAMVDDIGDRTDETLEMRFVRAFKELVDSSLSAS